MTEQPKGKQGCTCENEFKPPYCDFCIPVNPTKEDLSVCPGCDCELFYITDGNRHFCSKCKRELRNNINFKGGHLTV